MTDVTLQSPEKAWKIETAEAWQAAIAADVYTGSALDCADGFIHLSGRDTVAQTLALYFAGREGLVLVGVDLAGLGETVVWEASRGGALFPHIYGALPISVCDDPVALTLEAGVHVLPW
jgi:uncharacterized protein (DUF952 family)